MLLFLFYDEYLEVSIPDRVLGIFRPVETPLDMVMSEVPVSIPDRVLGIFRRNRKAGSFFVVGFNP